MRTNAKYSSVQATTASKEALLALLCARARRAISDARTAADGGNRAARDSNLLRALSIVSELRGTLDPSRSPVLAVQLDDLYGFVLGRLFAAQAGNDAALAEAARAFFPVALAFEEAVEMLARGQGSGAAAR